MTNASKALARSIFIVGIMSFGTPSIASSIQTESLALSDEEFELALEELKSNYPLVPRAELDQYSAEPKNVIPLDPYFEVCQMIEPLTHVDRITNCPKMNVPKKFRYNEKNELIVEEIESISNEVYCDKTGCARSKRLLDDSDSIQTISLGDIVRSKSDPTLVGRIISLFDMSEKRFYEKVPFKSIGIVLWNLETNRFSNELYEFNKFRVIQKYPQTQSFRETRMIWLKNTRYEYERLNKRVLEREQERLNILRHTYDSTAFGCLSEDGEKISNAVPPDRVEALFYNNHLRLRFFRSGEITGEPWAEIRLEENNSRYDLISWIEKGGLGCFPNNCREDFKVGSASALPGSEQVSLEIAEDFVRFCKLPEGSNVKQIIHLKRRLVE